MTLRNKPATLRATGFRERIRVAMLSGHLRRFQADERTLDIGCGWGFSLKINPAFYCVDADQTCIDHLKALGAHAYQADVSAPLPFQDGFFHNAFIHDVLEHLEEAEMLRLFRETRRILRQDGTFMNVVPNRKGYDAGVHPEVGHVRFVTEREIAEAAEVSGFMLVDSWHTPLPKWLGAGFTHNKLVTICRAV